MERRPRARGSRRGRSLALLIVGVLLGTMLLTPVGAHVAGWAHNWQEHIRPRTDKRYFTKAQANNRFLRQAQHRRMSLGATEADTGGGASYGAGNSTASGIMFPKSGTPVATWTYVLPADFTPGQPHTFRVLWYMSNETGCNVRLIPNSLSVARPDRLPVGNHTLVTALDGVVLAAPTPNFTVAVARFRIPGSIFPFGELRPGDSVSFGIFRQQSAVTDTCAQLMRVHGAEVRY